MTKQQVLSGMDSVLATARAAFDRNDLPRLHACSAEAYAVFAAARDLGNKKLAKQARDAYYGVTGMEDYVATSI